MRSQHSLASPFSRRRFLQGSVLLTAGSMIAACTQVPGAGTTTTTSGTTAEGSAWLAAEDIAGMPETTMRYWFYESPERVALGEEQVKQFKELYPNITVEGRTAPPSVDNEMLVAFIKAGTNSHVHQSVNNEDTWYITRDLLLPLQDLPGFQEVWDRMNPNLNYTWKDGNIYAISWYSGPRVLFYNKKMVEEAGLDPTNPPQFYSEYLEWAKALTKENQFFIQHWTFEDWWAWEFMAYPYYIAATGSNQLHSEDGTKAIFNRPEMVQVYELFSTLYKEGYNMVEAVEGDPFVGGQVAATLAGADTLNDIRRYAPEGFEAIVGPVPKPDGSTVEGFPTFNFVREFVIMREQHETGEKADQINRAAWEFMKFLLSPEQLAADFAAAGDLPPVKDLLENPLYTDTLDQYGPLALEYAKYAANSYIYDMNTHLESESMAELQKSYLDVVYDKKSPEEAVAWAEEQVNKILAEG